MKIASTDVYHSSVRERAICGVMGRSLRKIFMGASSLYSFLVYVSGIMTVKSWEPLYKLQNVNLNIVFC